MTPPRRTFFAVMTVLLLAALSTGGIHAQTDTHQTGCYDTTGAEMTCPAPGEDLFGQDANYTKPGPAYVDNGDGTVTDQSTGLTWVQDPGGKVSFDQALINAEALVLGGYDDWRVPNIKELYSLMNFNGYTGFDADGSIPYLDSSVFAFEYGDTSAGERFIDAQFWSSTEYVSTTMEGAETVFGVNFADGRIKGYPKFDPTGDKQMFVRYVRGASYGENAFVDNGDGTVTDQRTGLTWMQDDSGAFGVGDAGDGAINWPQALAFCEGLSTAGFDDWRLPDAKALQYIVDYSRSPDTTNSAAIDPVFNVTAITNGLGQTDYPFFWTSTSHLEGPGGTNAAYVAFGEAQGYMAAPGSDTVVLMDVHGAGAQRSDPKVGDPADYPEGFGPQGDVIGITNYARCVRGGQVTLNTGTLNGVDAAFSMPPAGGENANQDGQQSQPTQQPDGQNSTPPQEAIDACTGQTQGAACSFNTPSGTLSGTCQTVSSGLACVPANGQGGGGPGGNGPGGPGAPRP